jgi:hypothetical protein
MKTAEADGSAMSEHLPETSPVTPPPLGKEGAKIFSDALLRQKQEELQELKAKRQELLRKITNGGGPDDRRKLITLDFEILALEQGGQPPDAGTKP